MAPLPDMDGTMTTITIPQMEKALLKTLGKKGMTEKEIKELASYIMSFFGFDDSIIDNKLTSKDRDVFYMLENEGILKTFQDEVSIQKGKLWRIHYWVLNKRKILALTKEEKKKKGQEFKDIYEGVSDDDWAKHDGSH